MSEAERHVQIVRKPDEPENVFGEIINERLFVGTILQGKISYSRAQFFIDEVLNPWLIRMNAQDPQWKNRRDKHLRYAFPTALNWDKKAREVKVEWFRNNESIIASIGVLSTPFVQVGVNSVGSLLRLWAAANQTIQFPVEAYNSIGDFRESIDTALSE